MSSLRIVALLFVTCFMAIGCGGSDIGSEPSTPLELEHQPRLTPKGALIEGSDQDACAEACGADEACIDDCYVPTL